MQKKMFWSCNNPSLLIIHRFIIELFSFQIRNGKGETVPVEVVKKSEGLSEVTYIPNTSTSHTVHVTFGGVAVKNSPYRVNVQPSLDVSQVFCYGPGNGEEVKVNTPSHFTVDAR